MKRSRSNFVALLKQADVFSQQFRDGVDVASLDCSENFEIAH
jgi:hypothetical protein